ncbi:hypothetical protein PS623_02087 [Pseudomonas fluorescens]|jgi:hypothetical protein|uniref:hypothetical protein n=1 Tax=Pseudomonas TaxID=286 RepID=UPI0012415EFA|nr:MULTISPECIES: hypothetical protein [Pseudomonas]MBA1198677.1 hypothetical protein [Pseudomonas plecoglossicida]VVM77560.1 hypothetical protein PS623_02087 [Pseudomonas fluorescens]
MSRSPVLQQCQAGIARGWQAATRLLGRPQVRISFDIDDTLACHHHNCPAESSKLPGFMHDWLGEPLRAGTRELIRDLRRQNCSVWIYTSSGRTPAYIKRWLLLYGIRVDGVVNNDRHLHMMAEHGLSRPPSKHPGLFDIDLHVDDSDGVRAEGIDHGFRVVVVSPQDDNWTQKVLEATAKVHAQLAWHQPQRYGQLTRQSVEPQWSANQSLGQ